MPAGFMSAISRRRKKLSQYRIDIKAIDGDWIEFDWGETSFAILKSLESKGEVVASKTRVMFEVEFYQGTI